MRTSAAAETPQALTGSARPPAACAEQSLPVPWDRARAGGGRRAGAPPSPRRRLRPPALPSRSPPWSRAAAPVSCRSIRTVECQADPEFPPVFGLAPSTPRAGKGRSSTATGHAANCYCRPAARRHRRCWRGLDRGLNLNRGPWPYGPSCGRGSARRLRPGPQTAPRQRQP